MKTYEKLGAFYLGREYDLERGALLDNTYLYDSKDLVTHAVCVGMTGSGKTGLCVTLLEEAAIDGIPAIVIDPKGDLANLMLTFPDLSASSFRPWVSADVARQKGITVDAYAAEQAKLWKDGLAKWDQDGDRITRLRESAEFAVYTPGSNAATPVSVLTSLSAPAGGSTADPEGLAERASNAVTSLLGLIGIDGDPLTSREHILLTTILQDLWQKNASVDLGELVRLIQTPPVSRIGVLELESFYPSRDRFELSTRLNSLLASPRFAAWLDGVPLDIDRFLYTESGKPRISIFSIAHLDDAERMFFVSLLLGEMLSWMRSRSGTSTLRALLYMDEIFGYLPPVANPPSKRPLMTMLKQARAYGVGLVLATQNPADIDYKALSNAGTWFIGRLQTERDKRRLLDGLSGASPAGIDPDHLEDVIASLDKRVFLGHNVRDDRPVIFHTRWALSYLAGPLTREQLRSLVPSGATAGAAAGGTAGAATGAATSAATGRPVLAPGIPEAFLDARGGGSPVVYEPHLLGLGTVRLSRTGSSEEHVEQVVRLVRLDSVTASGPDWANAEERELTLADLVDAPVAGAAQFDPLPAVATDPRNYSKWERDLNDRLYRDVRLELFRSSRFKMISEPGESERDFRIRLRDIAREERDERVATLRKRYDKKFATIDDRIGRGEQRVDREKDDVKDAKLQTAVSIGSTLLSAFLGRKAVSSRSMGRATTAARGIGRASRQAGDVDRAKESLEVLKLRRQELSQAFEEDVDALEDKFDVALEELETTVLKPRRMDVEVTRLSLVWVPR